MHEESAWKRFSNFIITNSPGMRVIKTFLAVTICLVIEYFGHAGMVLHSSFAAIVCMQPTMKSTFKSAGDRTIGTLIAGLYGYLFFVIFAQRLNMDLMSLPYLLLIGVMTLPLMMLMVRIKKPGAVAITVIVYLIVAISAGETDPLSYTIERVLATLIGIGAALFINWLPILNKAGEHLGHVNYTPAHAVNSRVELDSLHPAESTQSADH